MIRRRVHLANSGHCIEVDSGETILQALTRLGFNTPNACRNGVCELCQARVLEGRCTQTRDQQPIHGRRHHPPTCLICMTTPETDCTLQLDHLLAPGDTVPKQYACRVVSVEALNHDVFRVVLERPAGRLDPYFAGQYLSLLIPEQEPAFFSIASSPKDRLLELHIQQLPERESSVGVMQWLKQEPTVTVEMPFGKASLRKAPSMPVILLASGTGFTQTKAIAEFLLNESSDQRVYLYWSVKSEADLYLAQQLHDWQETSPRFFFCTLVGDSDSLETAVLNDHHDLRHSLVIASGAPITVYKAFDTLTEAGLPETQFLSDVFEYAPR